MSRTKDELEQINLKAAYNYMREWISFGKEFQEQLVLDLHFILMKDIMLGGGGRYRSIPVYISDASHDFPLPAELPFRLKTYYDCLNEKRRVCGMPENINAIQLAAWSHAEFVTIHPFQDGNGRMSRLLLNYELLVHGFLPVYIPVGEKRSYYYQLNNYANMKEIEPLEKYIRDLESRAIMTEETKIRIVRDGRNIPVTELLSWQNNIRVLESFDGLEP